MKKILIVVDMQKDFVDGALGTKEACAIVPAAAEKIRSFGGEIIATKDTHFGDYLDTPEGKKLPVPHCIKGTDGWQLNDDIADALDGIEHIEITKLTFGCVRLPELVTELAGDEEFSIELIGLCTDICVINNALLLKAYFPDAPIAVDAACCAGVTPELHKAALDVMRSCQIDILNGNEV